MPIMEATQPIIVGGTPILRMGEDIIPIPSIHAATPIILHPTMGEIIMGFKVITVATIIGIKG